jgi:hypothetical protein
MNADEGYNFDRKNHNVIDELIWFIWVYNSLVVYYKNQILRYIVIHFNDIISESNEWT